MADRIIEKMEEDEVKLGHMEGYEDGRWILLDYGEVIVHIFTPELRQYYGLERLWGDAVREEFSLEKSG